MASDEHAAQPGPSPAPSPSGFSSAPVGVGILAVANGEQPIPLAPLPSPAPTAAGATRPADHALLDTALVVLLLALAFLLASFPARNSDLFLHLGAGKLLAQGKYTFGVDPFAFTTKGVYWANTNWLFDLAAYGVYSQFPENGLVILKGILIALTALAMVLAGRAAGRHRGWWMAVVGAGLGILALSARVPCSPVCVSYLFLAVLLWLLQRPHSAAAPAAGSESPSSLASYWPVPLLFALWVNLDGWFLLGLAVLALYVAGEAIQLVVKPATGAAKGRQSALAALGVVLLLSFAACLLNPYHYHVFATLPADLGVSGAYSVLKQDEFFRGLVISPFDAGYFRAGLGLSASGLTYFVLIALGLFAFVLNYAELRWSHVLTWLALLLLSAYQVRLIPFFAVAAGPILALNFQAWYRRVSAGEVASDVLERWLVGGRGLTMLIVAMLLVLAWPGWLQGTPYEVRRWNVEGNPGLARVAEQLRDWHARGVLNEDTPGFVVSPETAHQLAWLCPEERGFLDSRLALFSPATARDYVTVREALRARSTKDAGEEDPQRPRWRQILRDNKIHHLVLCENDNRRMSEMLQALALVSAVSDEFPLLYLENNTAIFGWRDPAAPATPDRFAAMEYDLEQHAFHPAQDKKAPTTWVGREPESPAWYDPFVKPRRPRSPDRDEAALYLAYFDAQRGTVGASHANQWDARLAVIRMGCAWTGDAPSTAVDAVVRLELSNSARHTQREPAFPPIQTPVEMIALQIRQHHLFIQDQGPPGATYLAVRAARRAIHADPDDARAYLLLGEAYWRLAFESGDRVGMAQLSQLENMRRIQAITAFNQSLLLQPEQVSAHERLAAIYQSMGYQDFRLKHMKEALKLHKAAGPRPGESPGQFKDRLTPMENAVTEVDKYVQKALDQYELKAANFKVIDRARQAKVRGLAAKALEVLEASDISAFAGEGMSMELDLFLSTGRVREVREWMVPAHEQDLGEERYATLQLLMFAATGDYDAADQELERLASAAGGVPPDGGPSPFRRHMATDLCRLILEGAIVDGSPLRALQKPIQEQRTGQLLHELVDRLRQQADYSVIRAVLAVEVGEDRKAEELLREYVEGMFVSEEATASGAGLDFFGRPLGQRYLAFLTRSKIR